MLSPGGARDGSAAGCAILAEVVGYGTNGDAYHMTQPSRPRASARRPAWVSASRMRGSLPDAVQYINAHGTSTESTTRTRPRRSNTCSASTPAPLAVSSTKSMTGHLLGGAGGVEAATRCLRSARGIPPTINYEEPDPDCDLDYVPNVAARRPRVALSNSYGFGGERLARLSLGRRARLSSGEGNPFATAEVMLRVLGVGWALPARRVANREIEARRYERRMDP